jgi:hypothetical protein
MPLAPGLGPLSDQLRRTDPRSGVGPRHAPPIERRLACIAGFFTKEADMVEVARLLHSRHGIASAQLVRLRPGDVAPTRFGKNARRWSTRWPGGSQAGLGTSLALSGLAGLLVVLLALGWWSEGADIPPAVLWLGIAVVSVVICLAVATLAAAWPDLPEPGRFETSVQEQLAKGLWAVVVHRLPRERQAGVVALLRGSSAKWCAVPMPMASRRL